MKRFIALFMAILMLALAMVSCNVDDEESTTAANPQSSVNNQIPPENDQDDGENDNKKENTVPTYTGMTVSNENPTSSALMASGRIFLANSSVNHKDPFGDDNKELKNKLNKTFPQVEAVKDEYYAKKNEDIYILIHFENPSEYEIQSFTLGNKKYANYMFENGSTMELLIIKVNVGDAKDLVEYTIDAIKYIDGEKIKDVKLGGSKTVKITITPEDQPTAEISLIERKTTEMTLGVKITDRASLISEPEKNLYIAVYNDKGFFKVVAIPKDTDTVTVTGLSFYSYHQFTVVAIYDGLDGDGTFAHILASQYLRTAFTDTDGDSTLGGIDWDKVEEFDDVVLNVIARNDYKVQKEWGQIEATDLDGMSLEVDKRNEAVEKRLGITARMTYLGGEFADQFRDQIMTVVNVDWMEGMNQYDIVACYGFVGMDMSYRDIWANLLDKDTFPYFDFSLKCWNQSLYKNGTVNNRLYLCSGDFNLSLFDSSMIMWHNKELYEEILKKTNDTKSPKDLQDTIIAGDWTYSELYKWATYHDNVDPESNKGDIFGLYMNGERWPTQPFDAIPYAWDIDFITTNTDGTHSYNLVYNDRVETAMTMLRNLWKAAGTATETTGGPSFTSGKLLFSADVIWFSERGNLSLREMQQPYSLIPWPKFDNKQMHYATTSQDYFTTMAVIDHVNGAQPTKGEAISAYLQYATEYSYANIRMFYFKEIVEPKYFGNFGETAKKSATIFNVIIDSIEFDFATIYSPMLNSVISTCWRYNVLLKNDGSPTDVANTTVNQKFDANRNTYEKSLINLDTWFGLIE